MDSGDPSKSTTQLTWENVGLAFSFILFDAVVSKTFGLGVGTSLVTAAVRCVVQLTLVAMILQKVFETNNPWGVAGIACELFHASCCECRVYVCFSFIESYGDVGNRFANFSHVECGGMADTRQQW